MCAASAPVQSAVDFENSQLLLLFLAGSSLRNGRGVDGLGLIRTGRGVDVSGLDIDVSVFAQLGQVGAQSRFELLHVNRFLDTPRDFFQWRNASLLMLGSFQDD